MSDYPDLVTDTGELTEEGERAVIHGLSVLGEAARLNALAHGFDLDRPFSEDIALIHSEASEALEEDRAGHGYAETYYSEKVPVHLDQNRGVTVEVPTPFAKNPKTGKLNKPEGIPAEMADIIIRTVQSADHRKMGLGRAVIGKHRYNASRPIKHGKAY